MKNKLVSALLTIIVALNLIGISSVADAAYKCHWQNGHKVCSHTNYRHCKWKGGYWKHGVYYHKKKVCW